jgi:putative methanogenesis marker protein 8
MLQDRDEHVIEAIGRRRIVIRNGEIVEIGEPVIRDCSLARKFAFPVPDLETGPVRENIAHRIRTFGMCTPDREVLDTREYVGFGASELLSAGMRAGLLDAVVIACDGAGTVVATRPEMVQGIGGRMSGLHSTCPYLPVMDRIEAAGGYVLDRETAAIDQAAGVALAAARGFSTIAVTVAGPDDADKVRKLCPDAFVFGVHVTGLDPDAAERLVRISDIVTSCASKAIRETAGKKALLQAGISIPVFAMTARGRDLILEKIRQSDGPVLVRSSGLPVSGEHEPSPLV